MSCAPITEIAQPSIGALHAIATGHAATAARIGQTYAGTSSVRGIVGHDTANSTPAKIAKNQLPGDRTQARTPGCATTGNVRSSSTAAARAARTIRPIM